MTKKIADAFYDKEVQILSKIIVTDEEGGVTSKGLDVVDTFKGNVNFSNCKKIQEDYGLDYSIDISITTSRNVNISLGNFIKYQDIIYDVTDILASDSHFLIVGTKCHQ